MNAEISFSELFLRVAETGLSRQHSRDGSMPPGFNGPHGGRQTPVRNTSHWLQIFARAWLMGGDERFRHAALGCARYLLDRNTRNSKGLYVHRQMRGKDSCNGLMGPAWTIEGLYCGYELLGLEECLDAARDLFLAHPFCSGRGLWRRVEPDGRNLSPDQTLNHQIWFGATGSLLAGEDMEIMAIIPVFLDRLRSNMRIASCGRIRHLLHCGPAAAAKFAVKKVVGRYRDLKARETGYQAFNLYALALLRGSFPEHPLWNSPVVAKALNYAESREFSVGICSNAFGPDYNPVGFELAYVHEVFGLGGPEFALSWLNRQVTHGFDPVKNVFSKGTVDTETATARIYECCRLSDDLFFANLSRGTQ